MPQPIIQPLPSVQRLTHWGEMKRCRSLSMTDTCHEILRTLADREGVSISEVVERMARQAATEMLDDLNRPR